MFSRISESLTSTANSMHSTNEGDEANSRTQRASVRSEAISWQWLQAPSTRELDFPTGRDVRRVQLDEVETTGSEAGLSSDEIAQPAAFISKRIGMT